MSTEFEPLTEMEDKQLATGFEVNLPHWVRAALGAQDRNYLSDEERMDLVIQLASMNTDQDTGGPFGAAVFESESGRLLSVGVNVVVAARCSVAHAEIVALSLAQQYRSTFDLGGKGEPATELVTSAEPCAMCLGAISWSGITSIVCGAREEDVRSIGFDEGPKHPAWRNQLQQRGISVKQDVMRREAAEVLRAYYDKGRLIYNAREGLGVDESGT